MVRVGSLEDMKLLDEETRENKTNMTPQEQIDAILKRVKVLNDEKDVVYDHVMKLVEDVGVRLVSFRDMDKAESKSLEAYFIKEVLPLLSVMIVAISIFNRRSTPWRSWIPRVERKRSVSFRVPMRCFQG